MNSRTSLSGAGLVSGRFAFTQPADGVGNRWPLIRQLRPHEISPCPSFRRFTPGAHRRRTSSPRGGWVVREPEQVYHGIPAFWGTFALRWGGSRWHQISAAREKLGPPQKNWQHGYFGHWYCHSVSDFAPYSLWGTGSSTACRDGYLVSRRGGGLTIAGLRIRYTCRSRYFLSDSKILATSACRWKKNYAPTPSPMIWSWAKLNRRRPFPGATGSASVACPVGEMAGLRFAAANANPPPESTLSRWPIGRKTSGESRAFCRRKCSAEFGVSRGDLQNQGTGIS